MRTAHGCSLARYVMGRTARSFNDLLLTGLRTLYCAAVMAGCAIGIWMLLHMT